MRNATRYVICSFFALGMLAALPATATENNASEPGFTITLKNGVVSPARVEVPAGVIVKITLKNTGTDPAEFESPQLRKEIVLAPGRVQSVTLQKPSAGEYVYFDDFHQDLDSAFGVIVAK